MSDFIRNPKALRIVIKDSPLYKRCIRRKENLSFIPIWIFLNISLILIEHAHQRKDNWTNHSNTAKSITKTSKKTSQPTIGSSRATSLRKIWNKIKTEVKNLTIYSNYHIFNWISEDWMSFHLIKMIYQRNIERNASLWNGRQPQLAQPQKQRTNLCWDISLMRAERQSSLWESSFLLPYLLLFSQPILACSLWALFDGRLIALLLNQIVCLTPKITRLDSMFVSSLPG